MRVSTAVVAGTAEAARPATTVVKIALYQLSYSRILARLEAYTLERRIFYAFSLRCQPKAQKMIASL